MAGDLPSTSAPSVSTFVDGDVQPEVESDSSSSSDSDFDPTEGLKSDPVAMMGEFCIDWIASLSREDVYSLSLLLFQILQQDFLLLIGPAAKIIGKYLAKNPKTIEKWRVDFLKNSGELPEFLCGKYRRMGTISDNEDLTERARQYVRENAFRKGAPNMMARSSHSEMEKVVKKLSKEYRDTLIVHLFNSILKPFFVTKCLTCMR